MSVCEMTADTKVGVLPILVINILNYLRTVFIHTKSPSKQNAPLLRARLNTDHLLNLKLRFQLRIK